MKLFKKNEKDKLNYKIGHKIFGDLWDDKKDRAIVLLLLLSIFIAFVISFINTSNDYEEEVLYMSPDILISELNNGYEYDLTVFDNNSNSYTYYNGYINDNIDMGTKKTNDLVINYKIVDGITYDAITNELIIYPYDDLGLNIIYYLNNYTDEYLENDLKVYLYKINYNGINVDIYLKCSVNKIVSIYYKYLSYD